MLYVAIIAISVLAQDGQGGGFDQGNTYIRSDANMDGRVNITDAITILRHLMGADLSNIQGRSPACLDSLDANDDGRVNLADPIFILNFMYLGGLSPPSPFPSVGLDPTLDQLGC